MLYIYIVLNNHNKLSNVNSVSLQITMYYLIIGIATEEEEVLAQELWAGRVVSEVD